jgi:hypothetical protein
MHRSLSTLFTRLAPFRLAWLLLLVGCLVVVAVPLAGRPPTLPPIFGQPGVILTFDPRLQQLERDIATGRSDTFSLRLSQAEIDAEVAAQMERLGDSGAVREGRLRVNEGSLTAAGVLDMGFTAVPVSFDLEVTPAGCTPRVELSRFAVADVPGWLEERARAFVIHQVGVGLRRGLGFCVARAEFGDGEVLLEGWYEAEGRQL